MWLCWLCAFDSATIRFNYICRIGDDCIQGGSNLDIYGNLLDQGGVPIYYGSHPDAVQINPFCSYVKIHENVMADTGQQPFVEKAEGEIYIYNNIILCLRSAALATSPGQSHGPTLSSADGYEKGRGYQGLSFGNFVFANNLIYNCTSFVAINGGWPSNPANHVVIGGNVLLNCKFGALGTDQYWLEKTSVWWDLPKAKWYEFHGEATSVSGRARDFGAARHENPGLIDPDNLNFHPASAASAVVGLAANLTLLDITTDFDGNPRPPTGNWTAGPYEWQGSPNSTALPSVPDPRKK